MRVSGGRAGPALSAGEEGARRRWTSCWARLPRATPSSPSPSPRSSTAGRRFRSTAGVEPRAGAHLSRRCGPGPVGPPPTVSHRVGGDEAGGPIECAKLPGLSSRGWFVTCSCRRRRLQAIINSTPSPVTGQQAAICEVAAIDQFQHRFLLIPCHETEGSSHGADIPGHIDAIKGAATQIQCNLGKKGWGSNWPRS